MSDTQNTVLDDLLGNEEPAPKSILDQLKGESRDAVEALGKKLYLVVPGYKSLYMGFQLRPWYEFSKNRKKYKGMEQAEAELIGSADTLADTLEMFYFSADDGETYVPLHEAIGAPAPIYFDDVLRERILEREPIKNSTQTVLDLLGNDFAIIDTARLVSTWLKDTSRKVENGELGG